MSAQPEKTLAKSGSVSPSLLGIDSDIAPLSTCGVQPEPLASQGLRSK
jgi:hypothetical protein